MLKMQCPYCPKQLDPRGFGFHIRMHKRRGDSITGPDVYQPRQKRPYARRNLNPGSEQAEDPVNRLARLQEQVAQALEEIRTDKARLESELAIRNEILEQHKVQGLEVA